MRQGALSHLNQHQAQFVPFFNVILMKTLKDT